MFEKYKEYKESFDKEIISYFKKGALAETLNYAIEEGKRIRPLLLIASYEMLTDKKANQTVVNYALALEFIHNYSLVHDDLPAMDDDDYRRNRLSVHKKYDEGSAILTGDGLLNKAYEILFNEISKATSLDEFKQLSRAGKTIAHYSGLDGMIGGQVIDVFELSKSKSDILDMYDKKTCGLIKAATVAAAYLSACDLEQIEQMRSLGEKIGLAFQLQDDFLDKEEDQAIEKTTYLTYANERETSELIDRLTQEALSIIQQYKNKEFMEKLVNSLVDRSH